MRRLVFVSTEAFPFSPEEPSRILCDTLRSLSDIDRARTTLVLIDALVDVGAFSAAFPQVRLVRVDTQMNENGGTVSPQHPPARAYSNTPFHWKSACVFRALADLGKECSLEYIEFADRGALAFCALQEHRLQGFLHETVFAVRLGASYTALMHAEARSIGMADLNLSDLERKCLRDCDAIVASCREVGEAARRMFGFNDEEWAPRLICHSPPVLLDFHAPTEVSIPASLEQPIVFTVDSQRLNRPDLFVRGIVGFMRAEPHYRGPMVFLGESVDEVYAAQVRRWVPLDLIDRMSFKSRLDQRERESLFSNATVVFSSAFDASCVTVCEASLLGARVILNATNPAFGKDTPWIDGVNCLKFDGTSGGLAHTVVRNFQGNSTLRTVQLSDAPWPWTVAPVRSSAWRFLADEPLVSIVVPHFNLGSYLQATLDNLLEQTYKNIEILVVDDASTDQYSVSIVNGIANQPSERLRVIRLAANVGLAGARNVGVRHAMGRYVLTLDADDLIHPSFLSVGVAALENSLEFDIVVTPAGYFHDGKGSGSPGASIEFSDYLVFSGEAVVAGLLENRFSTATALFRKSVLDRFPYDESLSCYEDWSLFMRMCDAGVRSIVTTDIFFYYRKRPSSMVHAPRDKLRMQMEYRDMLRSGAPDSVKQKSRHLLIGLASPAAGVAGSDGYDALMRKLTNGAFGARGEFDDQVAFASLKISRWLERTAPGLLRAGLGAARWMWRIGRQSQGRRDA